MLVRTAEHAHQIRHPERLSGWLVTTARRICLRIVNHANHPLVLFDPVTETVADPFAGPEQRVIDADSTRRLWNFVSELSPRRQALLRVLFTEHSRPYTEVARLAGIPAGGIGPTRARALAQLRDTLEKHGLGPAAW
jgi:RNA polymerase sigma factor (sigma-70 family)